MRLALGTAPLGCAAARRMAALGPVLLYFALVGESDTTRLLVLSQVVLSLQLPSALRRLAHPMGEFVLRRSAKIGS